MRKPWVFGLTATVVVALVAAAGVAPGSDAGRPSTEAHRVFIPEKLEWKDGPASLPPGPQFAVLEGDPSKDGEYFAWRIRFPDGYRIPPHWHPVTERVTVLSGTFNLGTGEALNVEETTALPAGSFFIMPPETPHFAWVEGETIIQLNSIGPFGIQYVDPEDDPRG